MIQYRKTVVNLISYVFQSRSLSNKSCIFTRPHRSHYLRLYPTLIVKPDGSTYTVRFPEPRKIIKLPLDLSTVSEEERARILENRKPRKKVLVQKEESNDYDPGKYLNILRKKG